MSEAQMRAVRTLLQALAGAIGAGLLDQVGLPIQWVPVVTIVLTTVIAQVQNVLEDRDIIPAILKPDTNAGS